MKKIFALTAIAALFFSSCKKDDTATDENGSIMLHFDNVAGTSDLALNTGVYTNATGQNFTVTTFNYYISNIKLKRADGSEYVVPQDKSYFLVKESDAASQEIELNDIPSGDYKGVTFTVGVDSLRSTANISQRTGVLDPGAGGSGMYWDWNSGYIFMKLEGTSPASGMAGNAFMYHIGGFGGMTSATINNIKTVTLNFPSDAATVRSNITPEVHLLTDVKKVMDGPVNISIATTPMIMFAPGSTNVSGNYRSMFIVDHVHND